MRFAVRSFLSLVLLLFLGPVVAQAPDVTTFLQGFIAPIRQKGLPIFVTSCRLPYGKGILLFVLGEEKGRYVEFADNGLLENGAGVSLKGGVELEDPSGGIGTIQNETKVVQSLLKSNFTLVAADELGHVIRGNPRVNCGYFGAPVLPSKKGAR